MKIFTLSFLLISIVSIPAFCMDKAKAEQSQHRLTLSEACTTVRPALEGLAAGDAAKFKELQVKFANKFNGASETVYITLTQFQRAFVAIAAEPLSIKTAPAEDVIKPKAKERKPELILKDISAMNEDAFNVGQAQNRREQKLAGEQSVVKLSKLNGKTAGNLTAANGTQAQITHAKTDKENDKSKSEVAVEKEKILSLQRQRLSENLSAFIQLPLGSDAHFNVVKDFPNKFSDFQKLTEHFGFIGYEFGKARTVDQKIEHLKEMLFMSKFKSLIVRLASKTNDYQKLHSANFRLEVLLNKRDLKGNIILQNPSVATAEQQNAAAIPKKLSTTKSGSFEV